MRNFENLKIAVAGTGYVGLSIAILLAQNHHVTAVDIVEEKVKFNELESRERSIKKHFSLKSFV